MPPEKITEYTNLLKSHLILNQDIESIPHILLTTRISAETTEKLLNDLEAKNAEYIQLVNIISNFKFE